MQGKARVLKVTVWLHKMFKTPKFWFKRFSFISIVLTPLSWVFIFLTFLRKTFTKTHKLEKKFIICIGNATVGGSGKTPTAIALAENLKKKYSVCFLSKGYGRKTKGFMQISSEMTANQTGDEPQLLLKHAPVYLYSGKFTPKLHQIKEDIIIMDDGLQNPSLFKNFSILIADSKTFGNEKIFPSGPLRQTIAEATQQSDCILYFDSFNFNTEKPTFKVDQEFSIKLFPQKVFAFSGLGNNQKFLESLQEYGFDVINFFEFPDHHRYKKNEIEKIIKLSKNLPIITTTKDFIKIPKELQPRILVLKVNNILPKTLIDKIIGAVERT